MFTYFINKKHQKTNNEKTPDCLKKMAYSQINPTKVEGFSKGNLYWIEDYNELGECIVLLHRRLTKNIEGGNMQPMWECWMVANNHKVWGECYFDEPHLLLSYENKLVPLEVKPNSSHN